MTASKSKGPPHLFKNPVWIHLFLEQEDRDALKEKARALGIDSVSAYLRGLIKSVTSSQEQTISQLAKIEKPERNSDSAMRDWWENGVKLRKLH